MNFRASILVASLLSLSARCRSVGSQSTKAATGDAFGFTPNLYRALPTEPNGNKFFSPMSIDAVLGMLSLGAKGDTQKAAYKAIGTDEETNRRAKFTSVEKQNGENVTLTLANALFLESAFDLLQKFKKEATETYNALVDVKQFREKPEASRIEINQFVEDKTNNKIKELLAPGTVDPSTLIVLLNAVYFKGLWEVPFNPKHTHADDFYGVRDGAHHMSKVQFMKLKDDFKFIDRNDINARVIELPYKGNEVSMIIVEPNAVLDKVDTKGVPIPSPTALNEMETSLLGDDKEPQKVYSIFEELDNQQERYVWLEMPRFKIETEYDLSGPLKELKFPLDGDFSGIGTLRVGEAHIQKSPAVSAAVHKAFIEVNEKGTEAAAATAITVRSVALSPMVILNKPFLFFVRVKESNSIIFAGRMGQPTEAEEGDVDKDEGPSVRLRDESSHPHKGEEDEVQVIK